jgi:choline dehydrogenase
VEAKNNGLAPENPLMVHVIKSDLTHNLPNVTEDLWQEVLRTVPNVLGSNEAWSPMHVYGQMLRMVAIVSGNTFIGADLCRRPEYLHASINYTVDVFKSALALKLWSRALRPIGKYFVPQVRTVQEHRERAHKFLVPFIEERKAMFSRGETLPSDMISWLVTKAPRFGVTCNKKLAEVQLTLSMAAIHTTCGTATQM